MPLIQVYHPRDAFTAAQRAELAKELTDVILEIEGGASAKGPKPRSIAWLMFHDVEPQAWFIGGLADDTYVSPPGKFLVRVYVPEGSLNQERKAMVHRAVDEAFFKVFRLEPGADRWPSIFAHIHEWGEGNVGIFGKTVGLADIGAYAQASTPEIRAHGKKHLAARAGWRAAAGFPD